MRLTARITIDQYYQKIIIYGLMSVKAGLHQVSSPTLSCWSVFLIPSVYNVLYNEVEMQ
jgi:hypothetical protein